MKLSDSRKLLAAAVLGLGVLALHSGSASAATNSSLYNCSGKKSLVLSCCNRFVQKDAVPKLWRETNSTCENRVVCTGSQGPVKTCYIQKPPYQPPKGGEPGCGGTPSTCRKSGSGGNGGDNKGNGNGGAQP